MKRAAAPDAARDRSATEALYDRVAQQGHFTLLRSPDWWSRRLWGYPGDWWCTKGAGADRSRATSTTKSRTRRGPFRLAIALNEFVAATPEAHRGLVGHLATLRDQVEEIHYAAPLDHAWGSVLRTSQNLRPGAEIGPFLDTGGVASGAMLRITDVKGALELLPPAGNGRGELVLEVDDPILPLNSRSWHVRVVDGRLRVAAEPSRRLPRLTPRPTRWPSSTPARCRPPARRRWAWWTRAVAPRRSRITGSARAPRSSINQSPSSGPSGAPGFSVVHEIRPRFRDTGRDGSPQQRRLT